MMQALHGQVLDDFTPGEVKAIALTIKSTGMVGEMREYWVDNDYFRRTHQGDPRHLGTLDVPGLTRNMWSRDDDNPTRNLFFSGDAGGLASLIDIWKTTDDYYWVDCVPGVCYLCDGIADVTGFIKEKYA